MKKNQAVLRTVETSLYFEVRDDPGSMNYVFVRISADHTKGKTNALPAAEPAHFLVPGSSIFEFGSIAQLMKPPTPPPSLSSSSLDDSGSGALAWCVRLCECVQIYSRLRRLRVCVYQQLVRNPSLSKPLTPTHTHTHKGTP